MTKSRSLGSNIFPSLKRVTGTVTIEPWNEDFNCSKLVRMQQEGIINELRCNGTDNGTVSDNPDRPANNTVSDINDSNVSIDRAPAAGETRTLSSGAWAGIGVALGLVVAGIVGAIVWFLLRKRLAAQPMPPAVPQADSNDDTGKAQLDGTAIGELGGKTLIREKANDAESNPNAVNAPIQDLPPVELEGSAHRPPGPGPETRSQDDTPGVQSAL